MPGNIRRERSVDFWPGFVDALATLLIVIIFLVLVFVLAQFYLGQAISGRDEALQRLNAQISSLADLLALERSTNADLRLSVGQLTADLQAATNARDQATARLAGVISERDALVTRLNEVTARLAEVSTRTSQSGAETQRVARELEDANKLIQADREKIELQLRDLEQLRRDITALQTVRADLEKQVSGMAADLRGRETDLTVARDRSRELEARLSTAEERTALAQRELAQRETRLAELLARNEAVTSELGREQNLSSDAMRQVEILNQQIAALRAQLSRISDALELAEQQTREQDVQIFDLGRRLNAALASKVEELARYRSEFFGRLREVLGDRQDVRIVGDRFVFQSEVLFDAGSAELGEEGKAQIARLAGTLKELIARIPPDLNWILRVDGHTDRVPIRNLQFPSNWELSTARAISVVKYLADQGVAADRLAATGFGEFQPLDTSRDDDVARRRNRRIELKLTER